MFLDVLAIHLPTIFILFGFATPLRYLLLTAPHLAAPPAAPPRPPKRRRPRCGVCWPRARIRQWQSCRSWDQNSGRGRWKDLGSVWFFLAFFGCFFVEVFGGWLSRGRRGSNAQRPGWPMWALPAPPSAARASAPDASSGRSGATRPAFRADS